MYEFKTTDLYDVAYVIKKAIEDDTRTGRIRDSDDDILFHPDVGTKIVDVTQRRFRPVQHDDDEEYYKRESFLFKESLKRYHAMYALYLQR